MEPPYGSEASPQSPSRAREHPPTTVRGCGIRGSPLDHDRRDPESPGLATIAEAAMPYLTEDRTKGVGGDQVTT
jgi:hypothetical protein